MNFKIRTDLKLDSDRAVVYEVPDESLEIRANAFPQQRDQPDNAGLPQSYLGTPVFSSLQLFPIPSALRGRFDLSSIRVGTIAEAVIVETALFDVSMTRNIITTAVQGRNGTIKEYVADGDFQVNVRGSLVNENPNLYPEELTSRLIQLAKLPSEIGVISPFLNNVFGITRLVIQSYSFPMTEGYQNVQEFTLSCISDTPLEARITQEIG
ncbi:MAG: DUF6046 domain-containing protein [Bacteroidota bacterium]